MGYPRDDSPFAPRPGAFAARPGEGPADSHGDPYGSDPLGSEPAPEHGPPAPTPAWQPAGTQPPPLFSSGAPGRRGRFEEPGGPGQDGFGQPEDGRAGGEQLYGAAGERYFAPEAPGPDPRPGEPGDPAFGEDFGPRSRRGANVPFIAGLALATGLVAAVGGIGVSKLLGGDSKPDKAASPAATRPAAGAAATPSTPPPDRPGVKIQNRATDPSPLSLKEVFGTRSFTQKGRKYTRTAWKLEKSCGKAVNGTRFASALRKGGCNQALRATFTRADGSLIGTIGVLNLRTEAAARTADKASTGKDFYLAPLAGSGKTRKIGSGAAVGTTDVRGHYLVLAWVQRPDGKTIAKKDYDLIKAFGQDVIVGSKLATALNYRGYAGKPYTGKP